MPADLKPVLARQMEIYAGFLEHTDHHVGRLVDALERPRHPRRHARLLHHRRQRRVSAEGTLNGCFNEMIDAQRRGRARDARVHGRRKIDDFGTPSAYNHYAVGWAHAMDTPYQWTKQVASHWGGTRNGTIVHWPNGHRGEGRDAQPVPPRHRRRADRPRGGRAARSRPSSTASQQTPIEGVSMRYSFDDADAAERHKTQYFEMFCNRGIYHEGWTAVTRHRIPWDARQPLPPFDDDVWELYDTTRTGRRRTTSPPSIRRSSRSCSAVPDRGAQVQRAPARRPPGRAVQPRPRRAADSSISGNSQLLFAGMGRLNENVVLNMKNKSHAVTAEIDVPGRRRRRRDHRAGRRVRRLEPLRSRTAS